MESPPADQPKTPERAEILDLLKASAQPLSPKQIAEALDKQRSAATSPVAPPTLAANRFASTVAGATSKPLQPAEPGQS